MKRLKMPNVYSKAVNRRTATAMAKRKRTDGQTAIFKDYSEIIRASNTNSAKIGVWTRVPQKGRQFLLHV